MKALVLNEVKQPLVLQKRSSPEAGSGKVIVKLKAAALNRRGEGNKAFEKMNVSSQFGKIVLRVSDK